jgi:hypothetical protein
LGSAPLELQLFESSLSSSAADAARTAATGMEAGAGDSSPAVPSLPASEHAEEALAPDGQADPSLNPKAVQVRAPDIVFGFQDESTLWPRKLRTRAGNLVNVELVPLFGAEIGTRYRDGDLLTFVQIAGKCRGTCNVLGYLRKPVICSSSVLGYL